MTTPNKNTSYIDRLRFAKSLFYSGKYSMRTISKVTGLSLREINEYVQGMDTVISEVLDPKLQHTANPARDLESPPPLQLRVTKAQIVKSLEVALGQVGQLHDLERCSKDCLVALVAGVSSLLTAKA